MSLLTMLVKGASSSTWACDCWCCHSPVPFACILLIRRFLVLPLTVLVNQFICLGNNSPQRLRHNPFTVLSAAAAKFTGSGGAVVVFCPNGDWQAGKLEELYSKAGFVMVKVNVGPAQQ